MGKATNAVAGRGPVRAGFRWWVGFRWWDRAWFTPPVLYTTREPDPAHIGFLDDLAGSDIGQGYKRRALAALDLRPGLTVLDVGCGPGSDLPALAERVTDRGRIVGVDLWEGMVDEARARTAHLPWVEVQVGDAQQLPLPDAAVDRARADRVVQHVAEPTAVFAELRRVLRPGGRAVIVEPDRDSLVIDGNPAANLAYNRFVCERRVRNPRIGRELGRLAEDAGLRIETVLADAPVIRDFDAADRLLNLRRTLRRAVRDGYLDEAAADRWLTELRTGRFLASSILFIAVLTRP